MLLKKLFEDFHTTPAIISSCQTFVPKLTRAVMQPGADLANDLMRQVCGGKCGLLRRKTMRDPIKECACKHIPCAGQVFWLGRKRRNVSLDAVMPDVGAMRPVCYNQ